MFAQTSLFCFALLAQLPTLVISLTIPVSNNSAAAISSSIDDDNNINLVAANQTTLSLHQINITTSNNNGDIIIPWNDQFYTIAIIDCSGTETFTVQKLTTFLQSAADDLARQPSAQAACEEYSFLGGKGFLDLDFFYMRRELTQDRKLSYGQVRDFIVSVLIPWIRRRNGVGLPLCDFSFDVRAYSTPGRRALVARGAVSMNVNDGPGATVQTANVVAGNISVQSLSPDVTS